MPGSCRPSLGSWHEVSKRGQGEARAILPLGDCAHSKSPRALDTDRAHSVTRRCVLTNHKTQPNVGYVQKRVFALPITSMHINCMQRSSKIKLLLCVKQITQILHSPCLERIYNSVAKILACVRDRLAKPSQDSFPEKGPKEEREGYLTWCFFTIFSFLEENNNIIFG